MIVSKSGALPHELAYALAPSVGLRNLLVHEYEKVDLERMIRDAKQNIGQFREYVGYISNYVDSKRSEK